MSDEDVARDPSAFQRLARESKELTPIVDRYRAYKVALGEITKIQEMVKGESDPELKEMAHEELRALESRRAALEAEVPLLLVPRDPNDDKNVLLEIRAGTGGEEAALFAAEIFRMYSRFAERRRWTLELRPLDPALRSIVRSIEITGDGAQIARYEIDEVQGDRTVVVVTPVTASR